jgi:dihydrofolate reductase
MTDSTPQLAAIYAIAENGAIGKGNTIPWRLPADLRHFKKLTTGHPIIMGRKTFESLGRPLPKRRNILITRNPDYRVEGVEVVHSLEEAVALCEGAEQAFLIGGAQIYQEAFEKGLVDRIYETLVHAEVEGDTFLQRPGEAEWEVLQVESHQADEKNEYAYTYVVRGKRGGVGS